MALVLHVVGQEATLQLGSTLVLTPHNFFRAVACMGLEDVRKYRSKSAFGMMRKITLGTLYRLSTFCGSQCVSEGTEKGKKMEEIT